MQPSSLTPNPKLFQQNRAVAQKKQTASRKGEDFAGLQTYIISEIDSGSDKQLKSVEEKSFLGDASSFSNSDSSSYQQNSSSAEDSEENQDIIFGALPKNKQAVINQIWQQTPMIKEQTQKADSNGFITQSPFSFKNPIFFSVPRDTTGKRVKLLHSKRQLFAKKEQSKQQNGSKPQQLAKP